MEDWKPLDCRYAISSQGRVRNSITGRILKTRIGTRGYEMVKIQIGENQRKNHSVHRLVALHFIPNPENKTVVNHIDGNPKNNRADNLEWCSQKENVYHSISRNRKISMGKIEALYEKFAHCSTKQFRDILLRNCK